MNKKELVNAVSRKSKLRKRQGERVLNALMDLVGEELTHGKRLTITGIGTFEVRERKEREFVNPRTNKTTVLSGKKVPSFNASTTLKHRMKYGS